MHQLLKITLIIIAFFLVLSFAQFIMSIFPPKFRSTITPSAYGLIYEDIEFKTKDGIILRGWHIGEKDRSTIIIAHGYPFDKGNLLAVMRFLNNDYNLVFFDFRSFGQSEGWMTTGGWREQFDIDAAVSWLKKKTKKPIGAYGFSLGAAAIIISKNPDISAVVADSSFADYNMLFRQLFWVVGPLKYPLSHLMGIYAKLFLGISSFDASPAKHVSDAPFPLMIIHGEKDSQIPVEHAYLLHKYAPNAKLIVIKNADHGEAFAVEPERYKKEVLNFFNEHLKRGAK